MQNNILPKGPRAEIDVSLSNNYLHQGIKTNINMANHHTPQKDSLHITLHLEIGIKSQRKRKQPLVHHSPQRKQII